MVIVSVLANDGLGVTCNTSARVGKGIAVGGSRPGPDGASVTETETLLAAEVSTEVPPTEVSAAVVSVAEVEAAEAPVLPLAVLAAEVPASAIPAGLTTSSGRIERCFDAAIARINASHASDYP